MKVHIINTTNFTAKNKFIKTDKFDTHLVNQFKNNAKDGVRKDLYNNIDKYIKKEFTKDEFLISINKLAHKIDNKVKLNEAEEKYIDDMLTTMDVSGIKQIPDKYLINSIEKLLKKQ